MDPRLRESSRLTGCVELHKFTLPRWRKAECSLSWCQLVDKVVANLVDNKLQPRDKTDYQQLDKRLKEQHGKQLSRPHNPKVGGSNPSPAIEGRLEAALFHCDRTRDAARRPVPHWGLHKTCSVTLDTTHPPFPSRGSHGRSLGIPLAVSAVSA